MLKYKKLLWYQWSEKNCGSEKCIYAIFVCKNLSTDLEPKIYTLAYSSSFSFVWFELHMIWFGLLLVWFGAEWAKFSLTLLRIRVLKAFGSISENKRFFIFSSNIWSQIPVHYSILPTRIYRAYSHPSLDKPRTYPDPILAS